MLKIQEYCRLLPVMAGLVVLCFLTTTHQPVQAQEGGKTPVIIIPGLTGSELVNQKTGELVWFKIIRSRNDDLRLPLSSNLAANRDNLAARDIWRTVRKGLRKENSVYGNLIETLRTRGYEERSWDNPKASDAVYVFAYDWRRDNVENARLLIQKVENIKRRLRQPDLKFSIIGHSMGGLIARYAAMYCDADLPPANVRIASLTPNWAGAQHFDKIIMLGTPNSGSMLSINSLVNGFAVGGISINLPFIQNISRFDIFTIPSIYQLLPHDGTLQLYDENLRPMEMDVYDPDNWDKYGWNPMSDARFNAQFNAADRRNARAFFVSALSRAKQFQTALNADSGTANTPVRMFLTGSDCKDTLDSAVIYRNRRSWQTLFKPVAFRRTNGAQVSAEEVKKVLFASGDSIVSKRSLTSLSTNGLAKIAPTSNATYPCEGHNTLPGNIQIQNDIFRLLGEDN